MYRKRNCATGFCFAMLLFCLFNSGPAAAQAFEENWLLTADSVMVAASDAYSNPTFFRKLMMGKNYRQAWETPVTLPVLNLSALGLTVKELGGGRQTKSLRLEDKDSLEWALRTIDKDVRPAIPKLIRNKMVVSIVQDMVSAAHPYAPLTLPPMAKAVGIYASPPQFYFVPDDTALGEYRTLFAGKVCMLEKRDLPGLKLKNTEKVIEHFLKNGNSVVDQSEYLKARIFDMLIADWDRHYDQWKWAEKDSSGKTVYLALPKDRDQAFFHSNGWLLKLIRLFGMKFTVGFTDKTTNLVKLNRIAWGLDRLLLNELSEAQWKTIASNFQQELTGEKITEAIRQLPPQLYALHGKEITEKLLQRRSTIGSDVLKYYRFLAREVTIYGSDQPEIFELTGNSDSLTISIRNREKTTELRYRRTFYPADTKHIRLLGLGGDDVFTGSFAISNNIEIEVDGGPGTNTLQLPAISKEMKNSSPLDATRYLKKLRKPLRIRKEEKD